MAIHQFIWAPLERPFGPRGAALVLVPQGMAWYVRAD
jgi:hypothetical protein